MLQGENSLLNSYKSSVESLEQDKKSLEQKVVKLEVSVRESQTNANILSNVDTSGDAVLTQLKEEKEAADGQVNKTSCTISFVTCFFLLVLLRKSNF